MIGYNGIKFPIAEGKRTLNVEFYTQAKVIIQRVKAK